MIYSLVFSSFSIAVPPFFSCYPKITNQNSFLSATKPFLLFNKVLSSLVFNTVKTHCFTKLADKKGVLLSIFFSAFHLCFSSTNFFWPSTNRFYRWYRGASFPTTFLFQLLSSLQYLSGLIEHPTRSRRVVGSNPIWDWDFSEFPVGSVTKPLI